MSDDDAPPFAPELADDGWSSAAIILPNEATRDSRLTVSAEQPPFAPELVSEQPPHEAEPR